jgi:hypothetical protein
MNQTAKGLSSAIFVIPANPGSSPGQARESSSCKKTWTPACAGVTAFLSFWEFIQFDL